MRQQEESNFSRDISILLVLSGRGTHGNEEKNVPGKANFEEHLEVQDTKHPRVEFRAHEEIVNRIAAHTVLRATGQSRKVRNERHQEAGQDGNAQKGAEFIDHGVQLEDASDVKDHRQDNVEVPRPDRRAVVHQLLASLVRERSTYDLDPGEQHVAGHLKDEEDPVDPPRPERRERTLINQVTHMREKVQHVLSFRRTREFAIIVRGTNPHIVHQQRKPDHHGQYSQRSTKLEVSAIIDLGIHTLNPAVDNPGSVGRRSIGILGRGSLGFSILLLFLFLLLFAFFILGRRASAPSCGRFRSPSRVGNIVRAVL